MQSVKELASRLGNFNRSNRVQCSTVCVTGPVGVGKSSFIVTVASALNGYLEVVAGAGTGTESFTREVFDHVLEYEDEPCSWKIRDTPGDIFDVRAKLYYYDLPTTLTPYPAAHAPACRLFYTQGKWIENAVYLQLVFRGCLWSFSFPGSQIVSTSVPTMQALVDARDTRLSAEEISRKLKTQLPPEYQAFNKEAILKAAYRSQVESDAIETLLADKTGCVVVLLSANTFTQCGSVENSHWNIQENSILDVQLKVCFSSPTFFFYERNSVSEV
jgi:hypothetical protein